MSRFLDARLNSLKPYVPGEQPQERKYVKLNTNELPYPASPKVQQAVEQAQLASLNRYPDPECKVLREKIAASYGVERDNVIVSNGSDEVLMLAFTAYCGKDRKAVFPNISYGFYEVWCDLLGVPYEKKALKADFTIDEKDYLNCGGTVFIANPNAPTAIDMGREKIEQIIRSNPDNVVVIDEAYVDFGGESCVSLINKYDNLLVVQTFSKSRAMAGARLGMAFGCKELIGDLERVRFSFHPYNIDNLNMLTGIAAIESADYYKDACAKVMATRARLEKRLAELGFTFTKSATNFIFAKSKDIGGEMLYNKLKDRGVLVRHFTLPEICDYNRITVGTDEETDALIAAIENILEEVK